MSVTPLKAAPEEGTFKKRGLVVVVVPVTSLVRQSGRVAVSVHGGVPGTGPGILPVLGDVGLAAGGHVARGVGLVCRGAVPAEMRL